MRRMSRNAPEKVYEADCDGITKDLLKAYIGRGGGCMIKTANEPSPDVIARAVGEVYMAYIRKSNNPKQMYEQVIVCINEQDRKD